MKKIDANFLEPSQQQLDSLLELYQTGKYTDAEKLSVSITEEFPKHRFAWKVLGAILKQNGRISESLVVCQKSVELDPQDAEAHYNLGIILQDLGKLDEAETSYRKAIALNPQDAEAHNNLGILLKDQGRLKEAEASCRQAIALKSDYAEAHYNLGNTLKGLGRLDEAEASYNKVIVLKPDYAEAHNNLGNTLKELRRLDEAEASYKKAIKLKPDLAEAHNNLGNTLKGLGRLDEAEASYKKAITLKPDFAVAHNNLGVIFYELRRLDEAEVSLRQAIILKTDFTEAHYNLGNTLKKLGRLDEAEVSLRQAITLKPDYEEAKHLLSALTGQTTNSAPREYVETLFNDYAINFENYLVNKLEYKTPNLITELIVAKNPNIQLGSVLDLGCGTGLIGNEIRKYCSNLEGIDLSKSMLEKASTKNIYDKLEHKDIVEYLSTQDLNFNYFISTDVFIYVGELSQIFKLIKFRNRLKGKFIFSTEHTDKDGFFLEQTGRYSHSKKYIENLCNEFGYKLSHFETTNLRKEKDKFIIGGLYLLDF
jgi:predicted TPR repeat methyltransferase